MLGVVIFIWVTILLIPFHASASLDEALAQQNIYLDRLIRAQAFFAQTSIRDTSFNPGNQLAQLSDAEFNFELRPDFTLKHQNIELMLKPRFQYILEQVNTDNSDFDREDSSAYINEWRIRMGLKEQWFLSYGREVLLWGPAMFISPSNPFFIDNGRSNPFRELGGRDYFRATYLPNWNWTFSLIGNTGQGRVEDFDFSDFERINALKIDYVGQGGYAGLIFSQTQDGLNGIGGFFQLILSDALLFYGEGGYTQGTKALYPFQSDIAPRWTLLADKQDSDKLFGISLLGLAYTFEVGPTLNIEYLHNNAGYSNQDANAYFDMVEQLGSDFTAGRLVSSVAPVLAQAANPRLALLRHHYFFIQFLNTNIRNQLDVTLRYTHNLDDKSSNFISIFNWAINDFTHLFALGLVNFGNDRTEFRRYIDNQWLIGMTMTF